LPNVLVNKLIEKKDNINSIGVSGGIATGKLVDTKNIVAEERVILYTKILSPELVKYFDKIEGIVSEGGGLLSHLSIMAREKNIPVIVNVDLKKLGVEFGNLIEINGGNGSIKKITEKI